MNEFAESVRALSRDPKMLQAAHIKLEDQLIDMRDSQMSVFPAANGMVVREKDGSPSDVIRIPTAMAVQIALEAIADKLESP